MLKHQSGFTLIELTLVIVIVGIMASSAAPKVGEIIDEAKHASVQYGQAIARNAIMMKQGSDLAKFNKVIYVSSLDKSIFEGNRVPKNAFVDDTKGEFCWATLEDGFYVDIDQLVSLGRSEAPSKPANVDCTSPTGPWSWLFVQNSIVYPTFPGYDGFNAEEWE